MKQQYRQGDVLVEHIGDADQLPADLTLVARDGGRVVLAYGEVTGHAHAIAEQNAELYMRPGTADRWLVIRWAQPTTEVEHGGAIIRHEEHAPIELAPGTYRVTRQREYSPSEIRNVAD